VTNMTYGASSSRGPVMDDDVRDINQHCKNERYWNQDLAPIPPSARKWVTRDMIALWVALAACIPTYMLASSLIEGGMNWWQALLTICLGNAIVLIPMLLNAHAGTKYGVSFPVLCRAPFGMRGANVAAVLRAFVACGWFGIQCWIGGGAIFKVAAIYFPSWSSLPDLPWLGINIYELLCFSAFWLLNVWIVWNGTDSVRKLLNYKAPLLILLGLALLVWAYVAAGGFGPMLSQSSQFAPDGEKAGEFWGFFFPALTANVGFWATLALNIPDFTRHVRSQRDQVLGQSIGLPMAMGLYAFSGVAVTSATVVIYGLPIWDPVELMARFQHPLVHIIGLFGLIAATLSTNLAANVIGPANDFSNFWPQRISFRGGVVITGLIGVAIQPWRLVEDPSGYIFKWLVAYSALLGAVGGVMIADYCVVRRGQLDVRGLYRREGPYWYTSGFHIAGIIALLAGILPCLPGFMSAVGVLSVADYWNELYNYAWFLSFGISFGAYVMMTLSPKSALSREPRPHR